MVSANPKRRKFLIVFNPNAGSRKVSRLRAIVEALEGQGASVTVQHTSGPGDAMVIASACLATDWDALIAAGGDGTLNEVINGWREECPPVGLIPLGTANLAALEMAIPKSPNEIARMLVHGPQQPAYTGRVNNQRFLLMTGVGFDAKIVQSVSTRVKRLLGKGAYGLEILNQLWRYGFPRFDVEIDGVRNQAASVIIANGHYYGGPYVCAQAANFDQPGLFACVFEKSGAFNVLRYGLNMLLGRLESGGDYRVIPARRIVIHAPHREPVQIDGDLGGTVPITVEVEPAPVLLIRMPASEGGN